MAFTRTVTRTSTIVQTTTPSIVTTEPAIVESTTENLAVTSNPLVSSSESVSTAEDIVTTDISSSSTIPSDGLGPGGIAGISIAVVAVIAAVIIIVLICFLRRFKRTKADSNRNSATLPSAEELHELELSQTVSGTSNVIDTLKPERVRKTSQGIHITYSEEEPAFSDDQNVPVNYVENEYNQNDNLAYHKDHGGTHPVPAPVANLAYPVHRTIGEIHSVPAPDINYVKQQGSKHKLYENLPPKDDTPPPLAHRKNGNNPPQYVNVPPSIDDINHAKRLNNLDIQDKVAILPRNVPIGSASSDESEAGANNESYISDKKYEHYVNKDIFQKQMMEHNSSSSPFQSQGNVHSNVTNGEPTYVNHNPQVKPKQKPNPPPKARNKLMENRFGFDQQGDISLDFAVDRKS